MNNEMSFAEAGRRVDTYMKHVDETHVARSEVLNNHVVAAKENHDRVMTECNAMLDEARAATLMLMNKTGKVSIPAE